MADATKIEQAKRVACCARCHGTNITKDASARWSIATQDWVLSDTHDITWCGDCNDDRGIVMRDAKQDELKNLITTETFTVSESFDTELNKPCGLKVRIGDKYIDRLCPEEALFVIASILINPNKQCYGGMKTAAEHAEIKQQRGF